MSDEKSKADMGPSRTAQSQDERPVAALNATRDPFAPKDPRAAWEHSHGYPIGHVQAQRRAA